MTARTDTKEKILDIAVSLLKTSGFNAFSYQHISSALGVKNAAIHYHYPSKDDLGRAVIERERERFRAWKRVTDSQVSDYGQKLEQFIDIYTHNLENNQQLCMVGTSGAVYFTLPPAMQAEVRLLVAEIHTWLSDTLQAGRERGVFAFPGAAADKAYVITSSLAGALQLARIAGNEEFYAVTRQLKKDLVR
jgi:TetR/AcrR family transcriptional regulator, transcriptional repressor for nem operon